MANENIQVEILRNPTKADWARCKELALNTMGKKYAGKEVTDEWKRQILKAQHSPIRTLMFTIRLTIPYFASVHLVRHKIRLVLSITFSLKGMTGKLCTIESLHRRMQW